MSASVSSLATVSSLKNSESYSVHSFKRNLIAAKKRQRPLPTAAHFLKLSRLLLQRRLDVGLAALRHIDFNLGLHALAAARMEHHQLMLAGGNILDLEGAIFLRDGEVRVRD